MITKKSMNTLSLRRHLACNVWSIALLLAGCLQGTLLATDIYAPKPAVPPGFMLVGGDILVPTNYFSAPRTASPYSPDPNKYWPGGVVPYEFDVNVVLDNRIAMMIAMQQWRDCASVQFVVRDGESAYVHIQSSTANNSGIGRGGGQQIINITNWVTYIMVHELGHCLGFDHTQTRSDRDDFVTINYTNIIATESHNFDVHVGFNKYGPYDFGSIMHYDQFAFTIGRPLHTIDVKPPHDTFWQSRIGTLHVLSTFDELTMSFLYPQWNWRFVDASYAGWPWVGSFLQPYAAFVTGEANVPSGGTLWIQPGTYYAGKNHTTPMTWKAPLGEVTLVN